jgi:predicted metal-dependent hydrolase
MEYQLIRSRRKTVEICIKKDGSVVVRAPLRTAQSTINAFVLEKRDWIQEKSAQMAAYNAQRQDLQISEDSILTLLGRTYPVEQVDKVAFDGTSFFITDENPNILKSKLIQIYLTIAQSYIPDRVTCFSNKTGWVPAGVRIGSANTSWGSCSGKNKLNFTWKLIMAEPDLIDYVVVHELAHTMEHNHSARFWRLVESILPDYQERRAKLRLLAHELQKQGWG